MRTIDVGIITTAVKELFINANYNLPKDISDRLDKALVSEKDPLSLSMLNILRENVNIAAKGEFPICQDTGMAIVIAEIGQDIMFTGGGLTDAINQGVRDAYNEGYLRKSVVHPLSRVNTGDNTPAVIYTELVLGDKIKLIALPKGFGSENMSRQRMFTPSATEEDIIEFVTQTVYLAGGNPCPPIVIGVGIGGTFEYSAFLAKKALSRDIGSKDEYKELETKILEAVNKTGVGVLGLGGKTTALGVNIETFPTHIASLPVAVNISCHATKHMEITL